MENEQKIVLQMNEGNANPNIIHVLNGALPKPIDISEFTAHGDINTVIKYIKGKPALNAAGNDTIIMFNEDEQRVVLFINKQHPHKITVVGELKKTALFDNTGIEDCKRYNVSQLKQLIRTMRPFFPDKDAHGKLMISLGKTDLQINQVIKEHNDDRGNIENQLQQNVVSNIDERFTLEMQIFKGLPTFKFEVNILMEVRDRGVSIWLESVEALELMRDAWEKIVVEQTEFFNAQGFTVINQ